VPVQPQIELLPLCGHSQHRSVGSWIGCSWRFHAMYLYHQYMRRTLRVLCTLFVAPLELVCTGTSESETYA
jgi:hypothetical protein